MSDGEPSSGFRYPPAGATHRTPASEEPPPLRLHPASYAPSSFRVPADEPPPTYGVPPKYTHLTDQRWSTHRARRPINWQVVWSVTWIVLMGTVALVLLL